MQRQALSTLIILLAMATTSSVQAQFHDPDLPASSVAWWTLTDELTPEAFRESYRSPLATLKRYFSDVNVGKADPLDQQRGQVLSFYVNANSTPELVPMWVAFDIFASQHSRFVLGQEALTNNLLEFGVSEAGTQAILDTASKHLELLKETTEHIRPLQVEFRSFQKRAEEALGGTHYAKQTFRAAVTRSDATFLAPLGCATVAKTLELLSIAKEYPGLMASRELLPELRRNLVEDDWRSLRSYLLTEVVSGMVPLCVLEN